jgi:zinc-ribbon domain
MLCKHCGTEIADKAIVCYRCGAGTTDPVRQPVPLKRRGNPLLSFVTVVLLLLLALYMGQASLTATEPNRLQTIAGLLVGAAIMILILRVVRRRR